jgi:FAD/FMN-containing dehydrogenase
MFNSWGGLPTTRKRLTELAGPTNLNSKPLLAIGAGRSYGDVGIPTGNFVISTERFNKFLAFDEATGLLTCEPGVLLRTVQEIFALRGWMLPVTPGTAWVTIAGAIANDVHGKNHHSAGSFGNHVVSLTLIRSDGQSLECNRDFNSEFFSATIGGLGLTGFIAEVSIQLKRVQGPWIDSETIAFDSLEDFFRISEESSSSYDGTVAWIDCTAKKIGRGIFTRGNHSHSQEPHKPSGSLTVPFTPPFSLVNGLTLKPFNSVYFNLQKAKQGSRTEHYSTFYYPLDAINEWNRIYGPKGFFQYQSVVPVKDQVEVTREMLGAIQRSGQGSFLAVLKTFGDVPSEGLLSFPMPGTTLALDFPNRDGKTEALFRVLDEIVLEAGGRLNPSKDARMSRTLFEQTFPNLDKFRKFRDPYFESEMSRRLIGEEKR